MSTPAPLPVSVRGGTDGIEAHYDDMVSAARLFGRAAHDLADAAVTLQRYVAEPGLISGGLIDPAGAFRFEADLLHALDAPGGVAWLALRFAAVDAELRAAAAAYELRDRAVAKLHALGDGLVDLPHAALAGAAVAASTRSVSAGLQWFATDDPALADEAIAALGGVHGPVAAASSALLRDGRPIVTDLGTDPAPDAQVPPRTVRDLMYALERRDSARAGAIDVRILSRADGSRSVVVDIPGTKSWQLVPNGNITSMATNARAIAGHGTSYERGVFVALERAGVRPTDDVLLIGHSEGGMVAVQAAVDARASGRFHVTHVVTAGAPIGAFAARVPPEVQVLAIENEHDLVPHLDGTSNPDRTNVTTVTIHRDSASIVGNHELDSTYTPGAADVDASDNPSVRSFLAGAGRFLDATSASTSRFVITRAH